MTSLPWSYHFVHAWSVEGSVLLKAIWCCRKPFSQWQRSFKAALPLAKILVPVSCRSSKTGPNLMGWVMEVQLSCYLVLLPTDSKSRLQDNRTSRTWPIIQYIPRIMNTVYLALCSAVACYKSISPISFRVTSLALGQLPQGQWSNPKGYGQTYHMNPQEGIIWPQSKTYVLTFLACILYPLNSDIGAGLHIKAVQHPQGDKADNLGDSLLRLKSKGQAVFRGKDIFISRPWLYFGPGAKYIKILYLSNLCYIYI